MKSASILIKKSIQIVSICVVFALGLVLPMTVHAGERTYEISFRAGSNGLVKGNESYKENQAAGYEYNEAETRTWVQPNDGYYFTGWNEELEPVTQKAAYVAQYKKIVKEAVYRVNYVDANGNAVATQKVATTNEGALVSEKAEPVEGYAPEQSVIETTVSKEGTEITFRYQSTTEPNVITREETVTVPGTTTTTETAGTTAGTAAGTNTTGTADAAGTTGTTETAGTADGTNPADAGTPENAPDGEAPTADGTGGTVISEEETPLGDTNLEEEETPLGNKDLGKEDSISGKNSVAMLAAGAAAALALAGIVVFFIKKRRA